MWAQLYLYMALDRTFVKLKEHENYLIFSLLKTNLQDFELERTCLAFHYIMRVNRQASGDPIM